MACKFDFRGKLVLVSGSTLGIGKAIAEKYVEAGASVIFNGRKQSDCDKLVKEMQAKYKINNNKDEEKKDEKAQKIYGIGADLSKADESNYLIKEVSKIGHLDVLINNMGIFYVKDFFEITDEEWANIFNVNVISTVRLCRAFLKPMLEKDPKTNKVKGGNIVIISSECGMRGLAHMSHYAATKSAQINIARSLAELTKGVPEVRVNSLLPGPTWTEGVDEYMKGVAKKNNVNVEQAIADYFKKDEPASLKQTYLTAEEIADSCLFLSSDGASGINGVAQRVEGGLIRHI